MDIKSRSILKISLAIDEEDKDFVYKTFIKPAKGTLNWDNIFTVEEMNHILKSIINNKNTKIVE